MSHIFAGVVKARLIERIIKCGKSSFRTSYGSASLPGRVKSMRRADSFSRLAVRYLEPLSALFNPVGSQALMHCALCVAHILYDVRPGNDFIVSIG